MKINFFIKNIYEFYRFDCCWPYAASFFLVLIIYWLDFFITDTRYHWPSAVAYGIILGYYLYNLHRYFHGKIKAGNVKFFVALLSSKIILWGLILALLYLTK